MNYKNRFIIVAIFMLTVFSSFAKVPLYKSKNVKPPVSIDSKLKIADKEVSKKHLDYGVATDGANLYIQICFHDQKNMSQMLSGGLNIYIDNTGKKKKNCVLTIQNSPEMQSGQGKAQGSGSVEMKGGTPPERGGQGMPEMQKSGESQGPGERQDAQETNANIPMQVSRKLNRITLTKDDEITFYSPMYDDKVVIKLEPYNFTQLMFTAKIPFSEIHAQAGEKLALGIETSKSSGSGETQQSSNSHDGEMSGGTGGPGGGPGGGMGMGGGPGGPGGSGGPGGMSGGGMSGGMQSNTQSTGSALKFWFLVQL